MNRFKFNAFLKEFPFLKELVGDTDPVEIYGISVKRMDVNLFNRMPKTEEWNGTQEYGQSVHLVLLDGKLIANAVTNETKSTYSSDHRKDEFSRGETILEGIEKHNVGDSITYIVWEEWDRKEGYDYVIYKIPRGKQILDYLEVARQKAAEQVKVETDF